MSEALATGKGPFKSMPRVIGGRYGLSSKEFNPPMVKAVFDELKKPQPKNHFTVGIIDDVTHTSLEYDREFSTESPDTVRAVFYGLGSDGTVGANKNSIKIIGEDTDFYAQGYFVYDSKKAGALTVSHLRFGPRPIRSTYLITQANFVACHQFAFVERFDVLKLAQPGATFLLNSPYGPEEVWDHLPVTMQQESARQEGAAVRHQCRPGGGRSRHGAPDQHHHADLFLRHQRSAAARRSHRRHQESHREDLQKARRSGGAEKLCGRRCRPGASARSQAPGARRPASCTWNRRCPSAAPDFVQKVTARIIAGEGDLLPVSALPVDGTFPTGTAQWEKRNIALEIPVWDEQLCIQCGKCVLVCPHSVIRAKIYEPELLAKAPSGFKSRQAQMERIREPALHPAGGAGGLYRLHPVRAGVPGQEQDRGEAQGHQHGSAGAVARSRARELELLPLAAGSQPRATEDRSGEGRAVAAAAVRVFRSLRAVAARHLTSS